MDLSILDGVTDPSDFATDGLRKLDSSLRCAICKEFYDAPVLLHCGHTFCSLCIRSVLPNKPECPTCRMAAKETHLIRNLIFDEAVNAWSDARKTVLKFDRKSRSSIAPSKKRKLHQDSVPGPDQEAGPSTLSHSRGSDASEAGDKGVDRRRRKVRRFSVEEVSISDHEALPDPATNPPVTCPLCNRQVLYNSVNAHMDSNCQTYLAGDSEIEATANATPNSKAVWGSIFKTRPKNSVSSPHDHEIPTTRIPKVTYGLLSLTGLRKLLAEKGLPTHGDKDELITRHERWIAIYNANLDRAHPRSVGELKGRLKELEDTRNRPTPKKIVNEKEWTRKNKAQFSSLVEAARPKISPVETKVTRTRTGFSSPPDRDTATSSSAIVLSD